MILSRVYYELFDWEVEWLDANPTCEFVEVRAQIRLEMVDKPSVFIAWNWVHPCDFYYVDFGNSSFCTDGDITVRDVSMSSIWKSLMGKRIELSYLDAQKQALCIRSADERVYCCSFAGEFQFWGMDRVTIGRQLPKALPSEFIP